MPVYVIGSTDPDDLGHIQTNLCPYFGRENATVTLQSVSTVANLEILNDTDYIIFQVWNESTDAPKIWEKWANPMVYTIPGGLKAGMRMKNRLFDHTYPIPNVTTDLFEIYCDAERTITCHVRLDTENTPDFDLGNEIMLETDVTTGETDYGVKKAESDDPKTHKWLVDGDPSEFQQGDPMTNSELWEGELVWSSGVSWDFTWGDNPYKLTCKDEGQVWVTGVDETWAVDTSFEKTKVTRAVHTHLVSTGPKLTVAIYKPKDGGVFDDRDTLTSDTFDLNHERLTPGWHHRSIFAGGYADFQLFGGKIYATIKPPDLFSDYAEFFETDTTIFHQIEQRMTGMVKCGTSWDSVPTILTARMREVGFGISCELSSKRKIAFKSLSEEITIFGMSYNFAVLLGFYGFGVQYPLKSEKRKFFADYKTPGLPPRPISEFTVQPVILRLLRDPEKKENEVYYEDRTFVVPYTIKAEHEPTVYQMNFFLESWDVWKKEENKDDVEVKDTGFQGWCSVSKTTGYGKMTYVPNPEKDGTDTPFTYARVKCWCQILTGDPPVIYDEKEIHITAYKVDKDVYPPTYKESVVPAKNLVVFEEKMRIFMRQPDCVVTKWRMDKKSQEIIKFIHAGKETGTGVDDNGTVYIQALRRAGKAHVHCTYHDEKEVGEGECEVVVVSDQVQYETNYLEAPYVGYSLSTPQLYVTTNIGYQVVRNSFTAPNELSGFEVCAVLQNSFSAGMYLNGSGDFPMVVNQFNLSNVYFTLVDSNYHPVKLFSPMFVIMKVESTPDPVQDIKQLAAKLPKNAATQAQVKAQADKQAKEEEKKKLVVDALAQAAEKLLPQTDTSPPAAPQPAQPVQKNLEEMPGVEPNSHDTIVKRLGFAPSQFQYGLTQEAQKALSDPEVDEERKQMMLAELARDAE
jgi:hypothetical protein